MLVMLRKPWPGQFRRVIRDETGAALLDETGKERALVFEPGEAVDLSDEEFAHVLADMGKALLYVDRDEKGRTRIAAEEHPAEAKAETPAADAPPASKPIVGRKPSKPHRRGDIAPQDEPE